MPTLLAVLLTLAVLCIGLAAVLPVKPAAKLTLGIVGVALALADLIYRLAGS